MDFLDNGFAKYGFFAFFVFLIFLFYIRPERDITPDMFVNKMYGRHYQVFKYKEEILGADVKYVAMDINKIKVYYIHFENEKYRKEFYDELTKDNKGKHMRSVTRDQRLQKTAAEKLSYLEDDIFYSFLFTKYSVIYSKTYSGNIGEMTTMYTDFYKPQEYNKDQMLQYYRDYFENIFLKIKQLSGNN